MCPSPKRQRGNQLDVKRWILGERSSSDSEVRRYGAATRGRGPLQYGHAGVRAATCQINRRKRSEFPTTLSELNIIAAAASAGGIGVKIASGSMITL